MGPEPLEGLCRDLLSGRGEASVVALARQVLDLYGRSPIQARLGFFRLPRIDGLLPWRHAAAAA